MAIENSVSNDLSTFVGSISVFDCCLSGVVTYRMCVLFFLEVFFSKEITVSAQ